MRILRLTVRPAPWHKEPLLSAAEDETSAVYSSECRLKPQHLHKKSAIGLRNCKRK